MRRLCAIALILVVCFIGSAASAEILLFKGDTVRTAGLTLGGWGSGVAIEASDRIYTGSRCIKITSQGLHAGGHIDFKNPIDLLSEPFDDTSYLQFIVAFATIIREGAGGMPGMVGGVPSSYYSGGQEVQALSRPKAHSVRFVLESADAKSVEVTADVPSSADNGWYTISVPFKAFGFRQGESFKVARIMVFTDVPDTVYVGQIGAIKDDTPITANTGDDETVAIYDVVTLLAEAEGGASLLRYSWNFGDRDPEGEDASGQLVSHKYTKGGDFTVKLTVSDVWGIKNPAIQTIKISVID